MSGRITNLRSFVAGLTRSPQEVQSLVDQRTRKIASEVLVGVVNSTPVDTGTTKGNWQVGVNQVPTGVLDTQDPSGGATIAGGLAVIATAASNPDIHIVNNAPAIARLNDGYSAQAGANFVEAEVDKALGRNP